MKKYLFFLSAVSIAMFTACSSEEDLADAPKTMTQEEYNAIVAEATSPSDVQIRLGMGSQASSVTRAPLESDADGFFTTPTSSDPGGAQYLGIYCLAQQNQTTSGTLPVGSVATGSISWVTPVSDDARETAKFFLMKNNQAARVVKLAAGDKIGDVTLTGPACEVQFMNDDLSSAKTYYYPYGNWYNYHFYGYYPRQTTGITEAADKITVNYTINGTQDIIHGTAKPVDAADLTTGFNAKYIRRLQSENHYDLDHLPAMAMEHKLTQVRFWVKTTSSNYDTYGYGTGSGQKKFQITSLKLTQVPTNWTLTVADKSATGNTEGQLLPQSNIGLGDITPKYMELLGDGKTSDATQTSNAEGLPTAKDIEQTTKLIGYAMIPTTEMMGNSAITIPERTDKTVPYFDFTISYTDASNNPSTFEFKNQKIDMPRAAGNDGILGTSDDVIQDFEPGKVYNVIIDIPVPEEIDMSATLEQWVTVTVTETSSQNINITVD